MSQTSYSTVLAGGRSGLLADGSYHDVISKVAQGLPRAGTLCLIGISATYQNGVFPTPGSVLPIVDPVVSAISILASGGTTGAAPTNFTGAALNGTTGTGRMSPARRITLTLSNSANWTAGATIKVTGVDQDGYAVTEILYPPASGNVVLTTDGYFGRVTNIGVSITGGAAATFTAGFSAGDGLIGDADGVIPIWDPSREPLTSGAAPNFDQYAANDPVPCLRRGLIWVSSETATNEGDPVFVRMTTASTNVPGQFGNAPAAGFSPFPKGVWRTKLSSAGLSILELR